MAEWWKAVVLGLVEGLTEFLPISSTGHLLVGSAILNFNQSAGGTFEIFIQLGAVLAVFVYYARDLVAQAQTISHDVSVQRFWVGIAAAFLPAAVIGILLYEWIKQVLFTSPSLIAGSLILGGLVFLLVDRYPLRSPTTVDLLQVSLVQALLIGIAQVAALVPGVSRSGATIIGGRLCGLDSPTAIRFSFYLAMPTLSAAILFDLASSLDQLSSSDVLSLMLGTATAFIVAWLTIGWLLRFVAHHTFAAFGIYRIIAGSLILALIGIGAI